MHKRAIKYKGDKGNYLVEDFYFNFSVAEILKMETEDQVSLSQIIENISSTKDPKVIIDSLKYIILKSYCEKSDDGVSFNKPNELSDAFSKTEAFYELHLELATDALAAANFINSLVANL